MRQLMTGRPPVPFRGALTRIKVDIAGILMKQDRITRLLNWDSGDALSNPSYQIDDVLREKLYSQCSADRRVFLTNRNSQLTGRADTQVNLYYSRIETEQPSLAKSLELTVDIAVAEGINVLEDGCLRHETLFQEISDAIEGCSVGTLGFVTLISCEELFPEDSAHTLYRARYSLGDIRI